MNRRSFFGFFPAAIAGVVLGVPVVKSTWGERVPAMVKWMGRAMTSAEREEFERRFIHSQPLDTIERLTIRASVEGVEQTCADLRRLQGRSV